MLHEKLEGLEEGNVEIVGVIKDYNQRSLKNNYEPMVYFPMWNLDYGWNNRYDFVRFESAVDPLMVSATMKEIETAWKTVNPEKPFQYFFLDNYFEQQYKAQTGQAAETPGGISTTPVQPKATDSPKQ